MSNPKKISSVFLKPTLIGLVISLFTLAIYHTHPLFLEKLTNRIHDYKFELRESLWPQVQQHNQTLIVAIDEPSINEYGRWPWDRKIIAKLLAKLEQASIIGLDMIFSESSTAEDDEILANTISNNDNIILGYFLRPVSTAKNNVDQLDILDECAYQRYETNAKIIGLKELPFVELNLKEFHDSAISCGFFSIEPDSDGLYRKYPLGYIHNGLILPPLSIQMLRNYYNKEVKLSLGKSGIVNFELADNKLNNINYLRLNYTKDVPFISASNILSGKLKPELFKNKIIFIGATETGIFDVRPTPVNTITPGVQIHYTAFNNLLNNNVLHDTKLGDSFLVIFVIMVCTFIVSRCSLRRRIFIYFSLASLVIVYSNSMLFFANLWYQEFFPLFALFLVATLNEIAIFLQTDRQATELKQAFSSYVSGELVDQIIDNPDKLQLGGDEKVITILFCDIRNFTSISEKMSPTLLVTTLNKLFGPLTTIVLANKGMLDKYIGDAMMVLFNAPVDVENHAEKAVLTALEMIEKMSDINSQIPTIEDTKQLEVGIGINTGNAVIGNMGSNVRFGYTAMGDAVNVASRIEALNKMYHTNILITEETKSRLNPKDFLIRRLEKIQVKGKEEVMTIYEVLINSTPNQEKVKLFEEALVLYYKKEFKTAATRFQEINDKYQDYPSELFLKRCENFILFPPEEPWNGVWKMMRK